FRKDKTALGDVAAGGFGITCQCGDVARREVDERLGKAQRRVDNIVQKRAEPDVRHRDMNAEQTERVAAAATGLCGLLVEKAVNAADTADTADRAYSHDGLLELARQRRGDSAGVDLLKLGDVRPVLLREVSQRRRVVA